jgi:hypothetical protein
MKKRYIAFGLIILIAVSLLVVVLLKHNSDKEVLPSEPSSTVAFFEKAQLGVTVDSWLKIIEIDEYYGRLAVVAENMSEEDVEYALLTVKTQNGTLTFNVSALLKGTKAVLLCNEPVGVDPNEVYTAWQTENKVVFDNPPVMNSDKLEIRVTNGSISLKNISGEDIESDIYIYYKDKKDNLLNGSVTYKTRVNGIKADSQTFVKAPELDENNCQIIFTDYDD